MPPFKLEHNWPQNKVVKPRKLPHICELNI
jgi:hypothetical protein